MVDTARYDLKEADMCPPKSPIELEDGRKLYVRKWAVEVGNKGLVNFTLKGYIEKAMSTTSGGASSIPLKSEEGAQP